MVKSALLLVFLLAASSLWAYGYVPYGETALRTGKARYLSNDLTRFTTVDPSAVSFNPNNPQSWNRYAYSLNNPVNLVDPNGEWVAAAAVVVGVAAILVFNYDYAEGPTPTSPAFNTDPAANIVGEIPFEVAFGVLGAGLGRGYSKVFGKTGDDAAEVVQEIATSKTRNPYGSKGKADHQAAVEELADKARAEYPDDLIVRERKIYHSDSNRRPDVQAVDPNTQRVKKVYEAERKPTHKRHRDRTAEYDRLGVPHETKKVE